MKKTILTASALLLFTSHAFGKVYKCKDEEGNTIFSDSACGAVEREEIKNRSGPSDATIEKRSVTGCLSYWKQKKPYLSSNDVRVENYQFQWVTVKKAGARRMLYLDISTKDESNPYMMRTPEKLQCLMLGDGVSVNTYGYELEP